MARTLTLISITALICASGCLSTPASADTLKSTSSVAGSSRDNSGRQLAMASPRLKDSQNKKSAKGDSVEAALGSARESLVGQLDKHKVSIAVPKIDIPDNMEKTADACYKVVRTGITFAHEHTAEFAGWMARYFKQISGQPKMTPLGGPYETGHHIVPPTFGQNSSKLYVTNEGRLKTVIVR
ncbi:MAG: hypothetical protein SGJ27_20055 [Candidatus Melainabacteria bacterium]|nr:hypothetical protein [Candidatus Melainabacteria bacterium]